MVLLFFLHSFTFGRHFYFICFLSTSLSLSKSLSPIHRHHHHLHAFQFKASIGVRCCVSRLQVCDTLLLIPESNPNERNQTSKLNRKTTVYTTYRVQVCGCCCSNMLSLFFLCRTTTTTHVESIHMKRE